MGAGIHPSWPGQCVPAFREWWVQEGLGRGTQGLCKSSQDRVGKAGRAPGVSRTQQPHALCQASGANSGAFSTTQRGVRRFYL